jgi:hypothetical protein
MSEHYRLVYMLAKKLDGGAFRPLTEHGEFVNRAAAKEYVKGKHFEEGDVYLVRKEVSIFYDRKLVDKEDS